MEVVVQLPRLVVQEEELGCQQRQVQDSVLQVKVQMEEMRLTMVVLKTLLGAAEEPAAVVQIQRNSREELVEMVEFPMRRYSIRVVTHLLLEVAEVENKLGPVVVLEELAGVEMAQEIMDPTRQTQAFTALVVVVVLPVMLRVAVGSQVLL
jgi:hypothetical protein